MIPVIFKILTIADYDGISKVKNTTHHRDKKVLCENIY
jgi:hypothetical protein